MRFSKHWLYIYPIDLCAISSEYGAQCHVHKAAPLYDRVLEASGSILVDKGMGFAVLDPDTEYCT